LVLGAHFQTQNWRSKREELPRVNRTETKEKLGIRAMGPEVIGAMRESEILYNDPFEHENKDLGLEDTFWANISD
jgi:hypothetical protein